MVCGVASRVGFASWPAAAGWPLVFGALVRRVFSS